LSYTVIGLALLLVATAYLLRSFGWRGAPIFAAVAIIAIISESGEGLAEILNLAKSFGSYADISETVSAGLKILGCGYLFGICADICREVGENGIAKAVELAGRVEIILLVLPFFKEIINIGVELIG
jgi:stage III sporulation protein AD